MSAIIETRGLTKRFGELTAVSDLELSIAPGSIFGFLGPNGSGKTTTIRMLLGLIRPTGGQALLFGRDLASHKREILPRVGAIIETPVFYPYLSGFDNLYAVAMLSGMPMKRVNKRIYEVLDLVDLRGRARDAFRKYSLGMKQRLGIAAALLADPELVMLDEPTNGLDPAGVQEIRQLTRNLATRGKTVFVSSHILHEVEQVCTHVGIMKRGKMIRDGRVSDLLAGREGVIVRMSDYEEAARAHALLQRMRDSLAPWIAAVRLEHQDGGRHTITVYASAAHSAKITALLAAHDLFVAEIRCERADLEELFLDLTAENAGVLSPRPEYSAAGLVA
jgi:ABC-2 type transport system ATP-binding protein